MSFTTESSIESLAAFRQPRSLSPEILERTELKDPFFNAFKSAVNLLMGEASDQGNRLLSGYLDRIAKDMPKNESTNKIASLITEYSHGLVHLGQAEAPPPNERDSFELWLYNTTIHAHLFLDSQYVVSGLEATVPEELSQYLSSSPEDLSCFDYALCQIGDSRTLLTEYENADLPGLLIEWGYQPIQEMSPGDLVLYLKDGCPTHLGIYRGDDLVQSKWGNHAPVAYLHKLETAPASYGNEILMFRPPYEDAHAI